MVKTPMVAPDFPLRVKVVFWSLTILFIIAIAELAARFIFPYPEIRNFDRAHYSPQMVSGPLLAQASLAHASVRVESLPDGVHGIHRLNLYGFRDREWQVEKKMSRRVMVVGDSMVEGFLTGQDETVPAVLQRLAREAGEDVEFWNLGVGGAGLKEYVALIQDAVPAFAPEEIVLVLYANDLLGAPTFSRELVKLPTEAQRGRPWIPRLVSVASRALHKQAVPKAWHEEAFPFFAPVPDPGNPWTKQGVEYSRFVAPDIAAAMRQGKFNPFNVGEVQGYEHYLRQPVELQPWLEFLTQFLGSRGIALSITYLPQPSQTTDYYLPYKQRFCPPGVTSLMGDVYQQGAATLGRSAATLGIAFQDMTPVVRSAEARGQHLYWNYDEHMRPEGYKLVAQSIHQLRKKMREK